MNCKQIETLVLAGVKSVEIERHLAQCAECRVFARANRIALGAVAESAPSAALDARIRELAREHLSGMRTAQRRTGWRLLTPEVRLALAASFATFLAIGALLMTPSSHGIVSRSGLTDERLLAWDMDPVTASGVQLEGMAANGGLATGELGDVELAQIEKCMEREQ